jgi:5-oxopent-3-ene-1,2,5-tricarboxylate decarboxylase/2-hydroxyhepta-2,4-diene-1,7-dioate isomerase
MAVIGVALNFRESLRAIAAPPLSPVLYLKTPNTWISSGDPIPCPASSTHLRVAGTLGVVIARPACSVSAADAHGYIAGYTVVNDVSIPHDSLYRPAIRQRCSDGFCPIGPTCLREPQADFEIGVVINNVLRCFAHTASLVRPVAHLIQDISEFMTLHPGDILLVGEPDNSPLAAPGDLVRVEVPGVGAIENKVVSAA